MCWRTDNSLRVPELVFSASDLSTASGSPWSCSYVPGPDEGSHDLETVIRTAHLAYKYGRWATRLAVLIGG